MAVELQQAKVGAFGRRLRPVPVNLPTDSDKDDDKKTTSRDQALQIQALTAAELEELRQESLKAESRRAPCFGDGGARH